MSFKIALSAGHGLKTAGKRCMKKLDPAETREWVLNSRIAEKLEKLLEQYDGFEIRRMDDRTGEKDVSVSSRAKNANSWGADVYLAIHHNAGIKGGNGGGVVVYVSPAPLYESIEWAEDLYDSIIKKTGLKGNRRNPHARGHFTEVKSPKMPAVLLELGFMDSATDVPIILTEEYVDNCAAAIAEVVAKRGKLVQKVPTTASRPGAIYVDKAKQKNKNLSGAYVVTSHDGFLNLRAGASVKKALIEAMPNGTEVRCYGWHTGDWLLVIAESGEAGFCNKKYLKRI